MFQITPTIRILIVDDEHSHQLVQDLNKEEGVNFESTVVTDEKTALQYGLGSGIDLGIINIESSIINGLELIRSIRAEGLDYPILVLSLQSDWQLKVECLEAGANDYVDMLYLDEEVGARVRALLRHFGYIRSHFLTMGSMSIDTSEQRVFHTGEEVLLTAYEYKVIERLMLGGESFILNGMRRLIAFVLIKMALYRNQRTSS